MSRFWLLLILTPLFYSNFYFAVELKINAPFYKNQTIKWQKKTDYISNNHELITSSIIGPDGTAQLSADFDQIELTEISIGKSYGLIYIDTIAKSYELFFPKDTILDSMSLKKNQIQLVFLDLAKSDINNLILDFNLQYDYFLYGDTSKLIRMAIHDKEFQDSLNSFKIFISDRYQDYLIKYLHMYIRYEIALIEQMAHQSKGDLYKTYLYHTYLKKNEIAYSNDAYMQFFNLFYKKPFKLGGDEIYEKIKFSINQYNDINHLKNAMANSPFYSNEKLNELIIIKGLYDNYGNLNFENEKVINMLNDLAQNSRWIKHKKIAQNCINDLSYLKKGTSTPNFTWINNKDEKENITDYNDRYVYVNFFSSKNYISLKELEIIETLHQKYDVVEFISINLDEKEKDFNQFLKENEQYSWRIGRPKNPQDIIDLYRLDHLPTYLLLEPNNKILQYPAYPPSPMYNNQSIDVTLFNLQKKLKEKHQLNIGVKD